MDREQGYYWVCLNEPNWVGNKQQGYKPGPWEIVLYSTKWDVPAILLMGTEETARPSEVAVWGSRIDCAQ